MANFESVGIFGCCFSVLVFVYFFDGSVSLALSGDSPVIWKNTWGGARSRACPGLISVTLNRAKDPTSLIHVSMLPRNRPENSVLLHLS